MLLFALAACQGGALPLTTVTLPTTRPTPPPPTGDTGPVDPPHPWEGDWVVSEAWCGTFVFDGAAGWSAVIEPEEDGVVIVLDAGKCIGALHLGVEIGGIYDAWAEGCDERDDGTAEVLFEDGTLTVYPDVEWVGPTECPLDLWFQFTRA